MDRLVRFFHGDKVKENGEFESMQEHVQFLVHLLPLMIWLADVGKNLGGH
jgi:hypothetical protein